MSFFSPKKAEVLKENKGHFFGQNNQLPPIDDKCCPDKKDRHDSNNDRFFRNRIRIGKNVTEECNC